MHLAARLLALAAAVPYFAKQLKIVSRVPAAAGRTPGGTLSALSRRAFLASTAALAATWALPKEALGAVLAAPITPANVPTTLLSTIRHSTTAYKQYRTLVAAPGEPYVTRLDVLGKEANPNRAKTRRSLLYIGHLTDIHVVDAQSPARLDAMAGQSASLWAGVIRPQDTMTVNVLSAMTGAMAAARFSPVTGVPMAAALNTGDSADQHSDLELQWYIDMLDGKSVTPNSGKAGQYEGPQIWPEATYAYHPDDPAGDQFGTYGFPTLPGMLTAAVSQTVTSVGMPVPWYAVYGNHDTLINGTLQIDSGLRSLALGSKKAATWEALADNYFRGLATDASPFTKLTNTIWTQLGLASGMRNVTADSARRLFDNLSFMKAHLDSPAVPGPVGHGFTQSNLDSGTTWWAADISPNFRAFGLDTCNQVAGPDGAVPQDQFNWLKGELATALSQNKMAIVISHHNSSTLENGAMPVTGSQPLIHADEFISMLQTFPNMVAWVNGHTHINTITAHPKTGGGGFWEITTASCIDYPQQQQLLEFVDNRDGTMSIFTTALDHTSPAQWKPGDYGQLALASLSRQLAANDWIENPPMRVGSTLDRNVELLLPAPFDLSKITDVELAKTQAENRARLMAYEQGRLKK
ncbi:MAG: TIGR03767 family metallophosphoesterase [Actinomycetes bacterium]